VTTATTHEIVVEIGSMPILVRTESPEFAAIVPVVEGAGGRVSAWSGGDPLAEPSLIASAGPVHDEVLGILSAPG
jgi:fructose-1,6-bisphosphatase/inositol monophosphatase family enzyme